MHRLWRVTRFAAVAALGASVVIAAPPQAQAFTHCRYSFCTPDACTTQNIQEKCSNLMPEGCTSTGGMCGASGNCFGGENFFQCTGNME